MKDKKSFIAYCDWAEIFDELPDELAGQLIKHVFSYLNDNDSKPNNPMVKLAFISIKQSLERDGKKYDSYIEKQRSNGARGGRPSKTKANKPNPLNENPTEPKKPDNDSDSVNGSVIVNESDTIKELINCFSMKENICRLIGKSLQQVDGLLSMFIIEQKAKGDLNRSLNNLRGHFTSWAKLNHERYIKIGYQSKEFKELPKLDYKAEHAKFLAMAKEKGIKWAYVKQ